MREAPSTAQLVAWRASVDALHRALSHLTSVYADASTWSVILEYELPRERGRRPDCLILAPGRIAVLEFKGDSRPLPEFIDQVDAYARDIREYHAGSRDFRVIPILALQTASTDSISAPVHITGTDDLGELLVDQLELASGTAPDRIAWLSADYLPLPSLISAARLIFEHESLPAIRRATSAGVDRAVTILRAASENARSRGERHLAFVTGVPGSGKTLVGLQFVYQSRFTGDEGEKSGLCLSGNGPLVKVLQHALQSSVFVQDVHGFLKQYGGTSARLPFEHVWVYDEAQRAWDAQRVSEKRGHARSEPEDLLVLGARMPEWAMLVGLVGEGQEIHLGEEAGLGQWNEAITASGATWHVHCPERIASVFTGAAGLTTSAALDLSVSLRSHVAAEVQHWITELLDGRLDQAATAAARAQSNGYDMYLTDDLERAAAYVRRRYDASTTARFGLVASSKAKNLPAWGINNSYNYTKRLREGPWYNDPPSSPNSCCQLREVVTEFQCQGLELDLPIVCWGNDLIWSGATWQSPPAPRSTARNPHRLRLNSYRVLLSRGRDGTIVFCPPDLPSATREALLRSGLVLLRE